MPITCPSCGRTSHHPEDELRRFCGACHHYTSDPTVARVALLVFTDGRREALGRTIVSFERNMPRLAMATHRVIVNDNPQDRSFREHLEAEYGREFVVRHNKRRLGFAGTIASAWKHLPADVDFVFHLEDDFELQSVVHLNDLIDVLVRHPELVQLVLKRQPWGDEEQAAGGFVEQWPHEYEEVTDQRGERRLNRERTWTTHRLFFSTNPSVYRRTLTERGWPRDTGSEGRFTRGLLQDPAVRFAFWGGKFDPPLVHHIGQQRVGVGY